MLLHPPRMITMGFLGNLAALALLAVILLVCVCVRVGEKKNGLEVILLH